MISQHDRRSTHSRRSVAGATAAALGIGVAATIDDASAGRDQVRKHRIKDIKRELQNMGADVEDLEALANTMGNIPGMESLEGELRTVIWNLNGKRRLALSI